MSGRAAGGASGFGALWRIAAPGRRRLWTVAALVAALQALGGVQPWLVEVGVERAVGGAPGFDAAALAYGVVLLAECAVGWCVVRAVADVAERSLAEFRTGLVAHLVRLPLARFEAGAAGDLVARCTADVDTLRDVVAAGVVTLALDVLRAAALTGVMAWLDWRLALAGLALLPVAVAATAAFRTAAQPAEARVRARLGALGAFVAETLAGVETLQLARAEERTAAAGAALGAAHADAVRATARLEVRLHTTLEALGALAAAVVVGAGAWLVAGGRAEAATLVVFVQYVQQLFAPVAAASGRLGALEAARAAARRVAEVLAMEPEPRPARPCRPPARGVVELDGVWLAYAGGGWALRDVSFRLEPGTRTALAGASGSGKTSVVALLQRFYVPTRGRVLVDGVDVRRWDLAALRRRVGVVLQEPHLFSASVAANLRLGRALGRESLVRAVERAGAAGLVARLGGLDAMLAGGGAALAAGERQLLAVARALAHDPAVLVLDEATAHLDGAAEAALLAAVRAAAGTRTVLMVAHRLAAVADVDRVLVLDAGRLVEDGPPAALGAADGPYARLIARAGVSARRAAAASTTAAGGTSRRHAWCPSGQTLR